MIDPGKMRKRIIFKKFNGAVDSYGEPLDMIESNWTEVHACWAAIDPVSGKEFYENNQSQSQVSHKIRCRWFEGLKTEMRIYYGARVFEIVSAINWEERGESFLIMAKELVE